MKEENYFSWNNIHEMADIDVHVQFASTLLGKYQWEPAAKQRLAKQLAAIEEKQNDKKLNISVIGEFSTGKSSFINALVGYELLAVNVIQGTTVAITVIEYDETFSITTTDFSGRHKKEIFDNIDQLRHQLHIYTTDPICGKQINNVGVTVPSKILKSGFRIIDTPGTNSMELWHESITRRAINELSDLSIILTDATQPMPATLINFVDSTLSDAVKDCAFVANKIDRISERERIGIVNFVKSKVQQNFDIDEPIVFPFSAVALTNFFTKEKVNVDHESLLLTTSGLEKLLSYTATQRIKAQARKILRLTDDMYATLENMIRGKAKRYQEELVLLERSKQTDLKPFITNQVLTCQKAFFAEAKNYRYKVESAGDSCITKAIEHINQKISRCSDGTLDELSNYIRSTLTTDIQTEGTKISESLDAKFADLLIFFNREITNFQNAFESEFKKLKIIAIKLDVTPQNVSVRHNAHMANIASVASFVAEELSRENWAMGGGAAAGAAIGTLICPGIGTAIGFLGGLIAGSHVAPDTPEVKEKVKNKLSSPLRSYYQTVVNDCMTDYDNYVKDINKALYVEINKYYATYASIVEQHISDWNIKHRTIKENIERTETDIAAIKNRQLSIKNILLKL